MSVKLVFCVPAQGRYSIAAACLYGLSRTCDMLDEYGIRATAIVAADDDNLRTADELGFGTVRRNNRPLGRKWNDAFQAAAEIGADYVVPFGTDDLIDPETIAACLPGPDTIRACRLSAVMNETGTRLAPLRIGYEGGDGVRIIPAALLEPLGYRPADEDRNRAIDTSIHRRIRESRGRREVRFVYHDLHPFQIVDFKTANTGQLNDYASCLSHQNDHESLNPWSDLAEFYPADVLDRFRDVYQHAQVAA